jgi:hypothetical protein
MGKVKTNTSPLRRASTLATALALRLPMSTPMLLGAGQEFGDGITVTCCPGGPDVGFSAGGESGPVATAGGDAMDATSTAPTARASGRRMAASGCYVLGRSVLAARAP